MHRRRRRRTPGANDPGAVRAARQPCNRHLSILGIREEEFFGMAIRMGQGNAFANRETEHGVSGRETRGIEQHCHGPYIIGSDTESLFTLVDYVCSIDQDLTKIVEDFLALQALPHTPSESVRR